MKKTPSPKKTSIISAAWGSLCLAFWALLPQFYLFYNSENRFSLAWTHAQYWAILLGILTVGAGFFLLAGSAVLLARKMTRLRIPTHVGFVFFICFILLRTLFHLLRAAIDPGTADWLFLPALKAGAYILLPILFLIFFHKRTAKVWHLFATISSLMLAWLCLTGWFWHTYNDDNTADVTASNAVGVQSYRKGWTSSQPPQAKRFSGTPSSIIICLFDECSFSRFDALLCQHRLPNFSAFLEKADYFTQADSGGCRTGVSIPRFLYQPDPAFSILPFLDIYNSVKAGKLDSCGYKSIFSLSDSHCACLVGYFLHYPSVIGRQLDICLRYTNPPDSCLDFGLYRALTFGQLSFLRYFRIPIPNIHTEKALDANVAAVQRAAQTSLQTLLASLPKRNITFLHIPFPHAPFCTHPDGTPRVTKDFSITSSDVAGYTENLLYADTLFGNIVATIKQRGDWDSSLVVVLSDHAWRADPSVTRDNNDSETYLLREAREDAEGTSPWHHVPLLIKNPYQKKPRIINVPVHCLALHRLFSKYLEPSAQTTDFSWWDNLSKNSLAPHEPAPAP